MSSVKNSPTYNLNHVYLWLFVCVCERVCGPVVLLVCILSACVIFPVCVKYVLVEEQLHDYCSQGNRGTDKVEKTQQHLHTRTHTLSCVLETFSLSAPALNVITTLNGRYQLLSAPKTWFSRALLHILVGSVGCYHLLVQWITARRSKINSDPLQTQSSSLQIGSRCWSQ